MIKTQTYGAEILAQTELLDFMYKTISQNMERVLGAPQASCAETRQSWLTANERAVKSGRKTAIAFDGVSPCGYFQYEKCGEACKFAEMQIDARYQGDKETFRALISAFLEDADFAGRTTLLGYINKANLKSQAVFTRIGFVKTTETERGANYTATRAEVESRIKGGGKP